MQHHKKPLYIFKWEEWAKEKKLLIITTTIIVHIVQLYHYTHTSTHDQSQQQQRNYNFCAPEWIKIILFSIFSFCSSLCFFCLMIGVEDYVSQSKRDVYCDVRWELWNLLHFIFFLLANEMIYWDIKLSCIGDEIFLLLS